MARGVKRSIDQKIAAKEEVVEALKIRLKSEQKELEGLYQEKQEEELQALNEVLKENALSAQEAKEILIRFRSEQQQN